MEGYVKPDSCEIISYSCGIIERGNSVCFVVAFECLICFPVEGQDVRCIVKNITKAGIRADFYVHDDDEKSPSPIVVFIARDHFHKDDDFNRVKVDDIVLVKVIGQRFELNDKYVSVIGKLKKEKSSQYRKK